MPSAIFSTFVVAHRHLRHLVGLVEREGHVAVAELLVHEARRHAAERLLERPADFDLAELRVVELLPLRQLVAELEEVVEEVVGHARRDRALRVLLLLLEIRAREVPARRSTARWNTTGCRACRCPSRSRRRARCTGRSRSRGTGRRAGCARRSGRSRRRPARPTPGIRRSARRPGCAGSCRRCCGRSAGRPRSGCASRKSLTAFASGSWNG